MDDDAPVTQMVTWADLERAAAGRLAGVAGDGAVREARWLAEEVRGASSRMPATDHWAVGSEGESHFERLVTRRAAGEPLQYVLGHWPYRTIDLAVDARALIPRPETEQVAGAALSELDALGATGPVVVDLGTGTGAIALAIATEHPSAWVLGVEASGDALELAVENRDRLGLGVQRVAFARSSWFSELPDDMRGVIDLIVTNPPYVATGDEIDDTVRDWEPAGALFAGEDGLDDLRVIIAESFDWLVTPGVLVAEIGADQGERIIALAWDAGFDDVEVRRDLSGRDRILVAHRR